MNKIKVIGKKSKDIYILIEASFETVTFRGVTFPKKEISEWMKLLVGEYVELI